MGQSAWNETPWSSSELRYLSEHAADGAAAIAEALHRSVSSVRHQASRRRLSLRRRGERRGNLLGQPRGESWLHLRAYGMTPGAARALRDAVSAGRVDLADVERQLRLVGVEPPAPLCPVCMARPQYKTTGVCRPCQLRALAQAHRDQLAEARAQRELWAARAEKVRALAAMRRAAD